MRHLVPLQQVNHGTHFRASTLRDTANSGCLDPVLGVDHAWVSAPTFPPHPHAGFSAVSYVFADAETGLRNQDSIGTRNLIRPGGLHWTAAGRGIVHEEVPAEQGRMSHLFQIFINLPAAKQSAQPFTLRLEPEDVPVVQMPGATVRVPLGEFAGSRSPLDPPTAINLIDIVLEPGARVEVPVAVGDNAFVVPVAGKVRVNGELFDSAGTAIPAIPAGSSQGMIILEADDIAGQAAVFSGPPLRQSAYWQGPMAMATREQLVRTVQAFERGEFGNLTPF